MTRRSPFDDIADLFDQVGEELEDIERTLGVEGGADVPVDVLERDDAFVVTADLPGFDPEDVEVTLSGRELTIHAEGDERAESASETDDEGRYHRRERRVRSVTRRLRLPGEAVEEEASATHENGVVTVTLPRPEPDGEGDGTQIDVE
ncbi:Hsp20/alpha crystallin family protein [Halobaculum sp. CBA1158]|uniref:Hsp20/alpha crystallin family protein n=1 Tax=Halobaculum sp. CBA1158 TaxID=2904243 RepID=UPI001F286269|nr:Hsp20/alpha crystallin family protein [Halobaculum sp. CBA1158]UIP00660.1 Hsp20/alpha crystallin family protein [Halobaculum sp. CBA1158]